MLKKLTPDINVINALWAHFLYKSVFAAFLQFQLALVIFWQKNIGTKAARQMLMKSTTGADAINISGLLNPKNLGNFEN